MEIHKTDAEKIVSLKASVLGELHEGQMLLEDKHPFIKKMLKAAFVINAGTALFVWGLFGYVRMFDAAHRAFFVPLMFFFVFGIIYGGLAVLVYIYARHVERQAILVALTPNRRYEWHSQYDPQGMTREELAKPLEGRPAHERQPPPASGAGLAYYRHSIMLVLCSMGCCGLGVLFFWKIML